MALEQIPQAKNLQGSEHLEIVVASVVADTNMKRTNYEIEGAVYITNFQV